MIMSDQKLASIHMVRTGPRGDAPVVLVHPVGLDLTYWDRQIEALRDTHDVVAYDLPGHGSTPGAPADWTFDRAATTLSQIVMSLGQEGAHIVGISVGGMIAQVFALRYPTLVRSLALVGTAASFPNDARQAMRDRADTARLTGMSAVLPSTIERWFTPAFVANRPDVIDRVGKTLLSDDPAIHAAMWDMISGLNVAGELSRISCPTLVLVGDRDPSCPPAAARVLHEGIAGSQMEVLADASHMSILEQPVIINEHLSNFYASLPRQR